MKAYLLLKNNVSGFMAYTSLSEACGVLGVSYDSAVRGKRFWVNESCNELLEIRELEIIKIKNRGKK